MCTEVAAADIRIVLVDAFATVTPDALPVTGQPCQIASVQICVVFGINELDPLTWKILFQFRHRQSLLGCV